MISEKLLKNDEKTVLLLRELYSKYGYLPYKMSKFEEYELYIKNKDFLVSDRVIAFNDTNGKLLALKPDVTLSIIKNGEDIKGIKQKVFYNENVYRVSESTNRYKEIMQAGIECIGDIDLYDIYEVILLAIESLAKIDNNFVLEISHLDILTKAILSVSDDAKFGEKAMTFIADKNAHDLKRLCDEYAVSEQDYQKLSSFINAYGNRKKVIESLKQNFSDIDLSNIIKLSEMFDNSIFGDKIRFDFSIVNNHNYYNGFVFKGFLEGISSGVLVGGQYDKLMKKMNRKSGAIGFAIYLDLLDRLAETTKEYDVDILILYDDGVDVSKISGFSAQYIAQGKSISVQKNIPEKLRYKEIVRLTKEALC